MKNYVINNFQDKCYKTFSSKGHTKKGSVTKNEVFNLKFHWL